MGLTPANMTLDERRIALATNLLSALKPDTDPRMAKNVALLASDLLSKKIEYPLS